MLHKNYITKKRQRCGLLLDILTNSALATFFILLTYFLQKKSDCNNILNDEDNKNCRDKALSFRMLIIPLVMGYLIPLMVAFNNMFLI